MYIRRYRPRSRKLGWYTKHATPTKAPGGATREHGARDDLCPALCLVRPTAFTQKTCLRRSPPSTGLATSTGISRTLRGPSPSTRNPAFVHRYSPCVINLDDHHDHSYNHNHNRQRQPPTASCQPHMTTDIANCGYSSLFTAGLFNVGQFTPSNAQCSLLHIVTSTSVWLLSEPRKDITSARTLQIACRERNGPLDPPQPVSRIRRSVPARRPIAATY